MRWIELSIVLVVCWLIWPEHYGVLAAVGLAFVFGNERGMSDGKRKHA